MKTIAITAPGIVEDEAALIAALLDSGDATRVHIRKPMWNEPTTRGLIESIPQRLYPQLSLHDHLHLAQEYGLGGVHLNSRNPAAPAGWTGLVSRSCHSIEELRCGGDYMTLSPIFDSISKPWLRAAFDEGTLREAAARGLINDRVYALGGVTPERYELVEDIGFGGAAFTMRTGKFSLYNFRLQLISAGTTTDDHVAGAAAALEGGCRWVQLRMKDASPEEKHDAATRIARLCRRYAATFIIDDDVELAATIGADGVHLGKNDMAPDAARAILGPHRIIGATANTIDDIARGTELGADYIGLGPLRFTTTKSNLSPVLGYEGYSRILTECRRMGIKLPVVSIGGITEEDIAPLAAAGATGAAVSGSILRDADPAAACARFIELIHYHTIWTN